MKKKVENEQNKKFMAAAKEHGCNESEREFAAKLKKMTSGKSPLKKDES